MNSMRHILMLAHIKKMRTYLPIILLVLTIVSCGHNEHWEEYFGKNLPSSGQGYEVLKIDDQFNLYLGGEYTVTLGEVNNQYQFERYCVLYSSSDFGRTWNKLPLPKLLGQISHIDVNGGNIVIVNQFIMNDSSQILLSEDKGRNWKKLFSYHKDNYIQSIQIGNDKKIRLVARERNGNQKVLSLSKSKIDSIILPEEIRHVQLTDKGFFGITQSKTSPHLIKYDSLGIVKSKSDIEFKIPQVHSKQNDEGDILFYDSYTSSKIVLLRNEQFFEFDLSKFENYNVKEPYIEDSLIIVDGFYSDDAALLGVIHTFLVSEDFGQTWEEEEIPSPMITEPGDMKKGRFLTYAGIGRFQERK